MPESGGRFTFLQANPSMALWGDLGNAATGAGVNAVQWEVELKFAVPAESNLQGTFTEMGIQFGRAFSEVDHYFNHPARDFATTDEALRLRQSGDCNFITYKGPRIDVTTKTRQELELPLPDGTKVIEGFTELLKSLGFHQVAAVCKTRRIAKCVWQGHEVNITWDEVHKMGTYVELEVMADDNGLAAAKQALESLARRLSLGPSERRSYLELLLTQAT
jgi:adenylate cyclase class 2